MADLVIREADGWEELDEEEIREHLSTEALDEIWAAVSEGDHDSVADALTDAGWDIEDGAEFKVIEYPCSEHDQRFRIWMKESAPEAEESPEPPPTKPGKKAKS